MNESTMHMAWKTKNCVWKRKEVCLVPAVMAEILLSKVYFVTLHVAFKLAALPAERERKNS